MARENKLKGLKRAVTETSSVAAMESYISQSIEEELHFDYKAITDLDEDDINNLKNYEKALLHEGKKIGQISLEIGKSLKVLMLSTISVCWSYQFFNEIYFILCQIIFFVKFFVCPFFVKILEWDQIKNTLGNIHSSFSIIK